MGEIKLSEAILVGCKKYPRQAFGFYADGEDGACVLGAANVGIGESRNYLDLDKRFPFLAEKPLQGLGYETQRSSLFQLIQLNDVLGLTREQIAAELARRGL